MEQHLKEQLQLKRKFIDHWRHYRHDLLNQIQLVKSYYQLDRPDEMMRCIDQLVVKLRQDSFLSKLDDVELAYMLLTYNYDAANPLYLDVEFSLSPEELEEVVCQKNMFNIVKELINLMEKGSQPEQNQPRPQLFLVLERSDLELSISAELQGGWDTTLGCHLMEQIKEKVTLQQGRLVEYNHHQRGAMVEIRMPWPVTSTARHSPSY